MKERKAMIVNIEKNMKDIKRNSDRFMDVLQVIIRWAVRALAILMTVVIVMGVVDVGWQLHQKAMGPPSSS